MITDTIAAIATPIGTGGIGIVRVSGDNALTIGQNIFSKPITTSHQMVLGKIKSKGKIIDETLVCYFKGPHSYTGEDVVEIHCHGGMTVTKLVLDAVLSEGAVPAQEGEFTRRAFLNGKMDLAQAEAVGDLLFATTSDGVYTAANQLEGALSKKISDLRGEILGVSSHLLAMLDFSDEVDEMPYDEIKSKLSHIDSDIKKLLSTADDGRIIKDGVNTVIVGAPNVGKSSFLNVVAGEDRAIVTDIEGTTRDVLDVAVNIRGCRVNLHDTAGIRESSDPIEQLGVERSIAAIDNADLILLILDGSRELRDYDKEIIRLVKAKNVICLVNKSDLEQKISKPDFEYVINISAKSGMGLDELFDEIAKRYGKGDLVSNVIITGERHKQVLVRASSFISHAMEAIETNQPIDMILGDLEHSISSLGEIDGMTVRDEIIDSIFANFCVGK